MLKEDINRLSGNLQCFIDLSLFDGNTGETFSKDCLDKDTRKQVTACEKALALVLGEKDTVDEISFAECAEILKGLQKDFSAHVSELKALEEKDVPLIVMEEEQAKAFGEVAELCEAYQMDEVMHNSSEKRVAIIDNEFKKVAPDKFETLDFTDSEIMRFNYEDGWNLKAILSYEKSKELVDSVYKGYLSKLASWLDVTEMTTDISLRNDGTLTVSVSAEQFISSDNINTAYVESCDLKGEKGDIVRDKLMSRARQKGYDLSELDKSFSAKDFTTYKIETSYYVDSITAISNKPEADGRYKFFQYLPVDIYEEPIVKAELITPEMRDRFIALYEQYENGDYEETPIDYTDGEEWAVNKEEIYLCDGYQDICNALSNKDFFAFIKDCVCKERNFEEDLKGYITDRHSNHYDVGDALYAAEQLGFKDLADSTRQMLKGKDPQIERE